MTTRAPARSVRLLAGLAALAATAALPAVAPGTVAAQSHGSTHAVFQTADRCIACHKGVATSAGQDVSIGFDWRASMMANSARDPYWQAGVRREVLDHPGARAAIEDECATCHMPMARTLAHMGGGEGEIFTHLPVGAAGGVDARLAADGVSCAACHQIAPDGLGSEESFTGGFVIAGEDAGWPRPIYGPFETDAGRRALMRSAVGYEPTKADHVRSSELCATCHTLYTHTLDEEGREVGKLPEQVPYLEWRESAFAVEGRSCQSCHMPVVTEEVPVTGVLGVERAEVSRHVFRGGNFFMLGMLNRHRDELGVEALPQELDAAVQRTLEHLATRTATVDVRAERGADGALVAEVEVRNLAGHKLPTAYPSRRAWLHVTVRGEGDAVLFESGRVTPEGRIVGNDNDDDPRRFEPHHDEITHADQVQIYEPIMVDPDGAVTTGLLRALRYAKDNRILPRGFRKEGAPADVAVVGAATADADFDGGGDLVRYRVPVDAGAGSLTVEVELRYQPIGFRWARNLEAYDAEEPRRFVRWYDEMAGASSAVLARQVVTVR